MSPSIPQSPTLEGLPKQFVGALRTLFDILDDKGSGFVKFTGESVVNVYIVITTPAWFYEVNMFYIMFQKLRNVGKTMEQRVCQKALSKAFVKWHLPMGYYHLKGFVLGWKYVF